jgi:hypothetical protein
MAEERVKLEPVVGRWAVYANGRARWGGESPVLFGRIVSVLDRQFVVARDDPDDSGKVWTRDLLATSKSERGARRILLRQLQQSVPVEARGTTLLGGAS